MRLTTATNGLLTITIAGVVMLLGTPAGSHPSALAPKSALSLAASASSSSKAPLVSVDKPLDDSCLRVPVAHPLTK